MVEVGHIRPSPQQKMHELEEQSGKGSAREQLETDLKLAGLVSRSNPAKAIDICRKCIAVATDIDCSDAVARAHQCLAQAYWCMASNEKALEHAGAALGHFSEVDNNSEEARTHLLFSAIRYKQGRLREARESALIAKQLAEGAGDHEVRAIVLDTLGGICSAAGETKLSLRYRLQSAEILQEIGNEYRLAIAYINIGNIHRQEDSALALQFYEQAIEILESAEPNGYPIAGAKHNLGHLLWKQGRLAEALEELENGLEIRERAGDTSGIVASCITLGEYFHAEGNLDRARSFFSRAATEADRLDAPKSIWLANLGLSKVAESSGDPITALKLYKKAATGLATLAREREVHDFGSVED